MSSTYIVEPQESGSKKDNTLIIVVSDDGTISVDQETLQNLIMNQSNANVSVVRVGQAEGDAENGDITLTVDPPAFTSTDTVTTPGTVISTDTTGLVDPFMEMDPEQLERLETALQSEEAKQILGENVTAMLDMLTVEEQQNSLKYSVELDHCYTSRLSPSDPKPSDPLPIANSPDIDDMQYMHPVSTPQSVSVSTPSSVKSANPVPTKEKIVTKIGKPVGRPRREVRTATPSITSTPKTVSNAAPRNMLNMLLPGVNKVSTAEPEASQEGTEEDDASSSSESSESEPPSDNDSDFGPRPRRGVRARGGRKGLTTRGGSMTATRRRGSNKHLDVEQVRRLNMEMAAAVDAMKSPEKDKPERVSSTRGRKQVRTLSGKKKDDSALAHLTPDFEASLEYEKPLQTTNQVKANLINANMIKGDMILTKPGQGRNNQKVIFVQKQIMMKGNEYKNMGLKKQVVVPKSNVLNQVNAKVASVKDGKLSPASSKAGLQSSPTGQPKVTLAQTSVVQPQVSQQHSSRIIASTPMKIKSADVKKERKKSDTMDTSLKSDVEGGKPVESKMPEVVKKYQKKEHRKSPAHLADSMGPALFSTPDIIRRVSTSSESKVPETPSTPTTPTLNTSGVAICTSVTPTTSILSVPGSATSLSSNLSREPVLNTSVPPRRLESLPKVESDSQPKLQMSHSNQKLDTKVSLAELHPSLDPASNTAQPEKATHSPEHATVPNHIVSEQSGIEGEEHLLATLEMEASKHEEELLAEALLLQEELGVDLADHAALVDQASAAPVMEPLLQSTFVPSMIMSDQSCAKGPDASASLSNSASDLKKRDEKEPIQIVRGGRVITLPPIEAPATRSKKLQVKGDTSPKKGDLNRRSDKIAKQLLQHQQQLQQLRQKAELDSDLDDEEDDEDDNSDSEDDPDRLWCICKRPHNNRFMICCDVCEDWFHGKCVHVSKAMGQQMEAKGIEWVCPNCLKKKADEIKIKHSPQSSTPKQWKSSESGLHRLEGEDASPDTTPVSPAEELPLPSNQSAAISGVTQCVVCKKEARNSSIYCSDACILTHAQESVTKDKPPAPTPPPQLQTKVVKTPSDSPKPKMDGRVIVFDRKSGKVLAGADAPSASNLKTWLKENPTFEVVRPNSLNTVQIGGKMVTAIQTSGIKSGPQTVAKGPGQAKMVYTKVPGSKQTILAPSNKKMILISQQRQTSGSPSPKAVQPRQTILTTAIKAASAASKQLTLKAMTQQQAKSPGPTTPKREVPVKKVEKEKPTPPPQKSPQSVKSPPPKKPETEPIRLNVRKTLAELLTTRIKDVDDLTLSEEEINELALNIELELYKFFRDTGAKYKAKYRSLVFNIKDTKNLTLFRKIADRSLAPDAVVRLSPEEMASQELAEWREKETKHQLEMIKKNELDLMSQAKSIVVKTHKGEQIIENDGGIDHVDLKTPVQDIVSALNSGDSIGSTIEEEREASDASRSKDDSKKPRGTEEKKKKDRDRASGRERDRGKEKRDRSSSRSKRRRSKEREKSRDRRSTRNKESKRDKDRDRERDRDRDRDREKDRGREKYRKNRGGTGTRNKGGHKERKEDDKKKEQSPPPSDKPIEDRLWRHVEEETTTNTFDGNESDLSDREPSSTVTIKTPDINEDVERERERERESETPKEAARGPLQTVWRGFVNMVDVAKFFITAQEVSGHARDLMEDLPDTVDVIGRISHETVWDYISKMKKTGSKEILVIRLTAANDEEKIPYITLYSYLNSRSRLGVVGNVSKNIKDFYIMPFSSQSSLPQVLLPIDGPGFEERRPHLLLGIIVRNKRKRVSAVPSAIPPKISKKDSDRSFTPPLGALSKDKANPSPPASPSVHRKTPLSESLKEKQVVTAMTLDTLNKAHVGMSRTVIDSATISKIVPELSSKLDLTSSPGKAQLDDDGDEPYSPGQMDEDIADDVPKAADAAVNLLSPAKNSTELQRKMDELNRQIEEQKQQIQNISSSFLGESTPTLPGLGLDPPSADDSEAYSPSDSRSFTPPPQGLSKFAQPILDKVSDITIPPNLQEILANVKRQESSKVDPYLPAKPSATFLTSVNSAAYQKPEKHPKPTTPGRSSLEKTTYDTPPPPAKETKSTLRSLSDLDLIKKAEEELAAVAAAAVMRNPSPSISTNVPQLPRVPAAPILLPPAAALGVVAPVASFSSPRDSPEKNLGYQNRDIGIVDSAKRAFASDQPKPPGLEDEDIPPVFPTTPPTMENVSKSATPAKFVPKSGIVLSVKRKPGDDNGSPVPKAPRTKSRWGQGPSD
ncbi:uncharacterized protein LOC105696523 isoform X2 [Orussus abietinus]|uniref:uncharacterized protein LOC105696523 isoform X2 n=1 Tax=Orussus abietinus TaxID=222816 RepID=UPI0006257287|nr:uncharacterized protein LOC105696523 isoform X2 [Orussus abietinus]